MTHTIFAANAAGKQRGRPWAKGESDNPRGKRQGARHRTTLAAEALLDGEAKALTRKAIELALVGETVALRLCLDRILPPASRAPSAIRAAALAIASRCRHGNGGYRSRGGTCSALKATNPARFPGSAIP